MPGPALAELCRSLAALSHDEGALNTVREFSERLRNTTTRLDIFNATGAILVRPITVEQTRAAGFNEEDDNFSVLQGDVVSSESAYFMGERVCSSPKYVVLNSSGV